MKPLVYVGSSWKNKDALDAVHLAIRATGLHTWDFRNNGFWWEDVDPEFLADAHRFLDAPESHAAFDYDRRGLDAAVAGFFLMPAGVSTALEVGYLVGRGVPVVVWGPSREPRMDIMWKLASAVLPPTVTLGEAVLGLLALTGVVTR